MELELKNVLSEAETAQVTKLINNLGLKKNISYKKDPASSGEDSHYHHILYREKDEITAYAVLSHFLEEEIECVFVIDNDEAVFKKMYELMIDFAKSKAIREIFFIVDEKDTFTSSLVKNITGPHRFSEIRMNLDISSFRPRKTIHTTITDAGKNDTDAIAALDSEAFGNALDADDLTGIKAAHIGNELIGKIKVYENADSAGIYGFVVDPLHRGKGYGREILNHTVNDLLSKGIKEIFLEVNSDNFSAFSLYESECFYVKAKFDYYKLSMQY